MKTASFSTSHLSGEQLEVANIVKAVLGPDALDGGNTSFVDPRDWLKRGEEYGLSSVLILVHDGGDLARYVNYDYGQYDLCQLLSDALAAKGYLIEQCTCWYAAVYKA